MARIPLSKAKAILYKTRGVRSKSAPSGIQRELNWDAHVSAMSLPKSKFKTKVMKKTYGKLYRARNKEKKLLSQLNLHKLNKYYFN